MSDIGSNDPADLTIALVAIHDSETDSYSSYLEHELPELWKVLERTDILVGYNSDHFDIPLLNKYYPGDLTGIKSLDLMHEVYLAMVGVSNSIRLPKRRSARKKRGRRTIAPLVARG